MTDSIDPIISSVSYRDTVWHWYWYALGTRYGILLPLAGLVATALILVVCLRCKNSALSPLVVLLVPLPAIVGLLTACDTLFYCLMYPSSYSPTAADYAEWWEQVFFAALVGLWHTLPGLSSAIILLTWRSLSDRNPSPCI